MLKRAIRIILGISMMLGLIVLASACTAKSEPEYAGSITEDTLIGMNENDYAKFSEHFDEAMKNAIPEANFIQLGAFLKQVIGDYISKEFWTVEKQGEYTVVKYKAKYSNEPADVIVTVSFHEIGGEPYLAGLWFDSPKLREQ